MSIASVMWHLKAADLERALVGPPRQNSRAMRVTMSRWDQRGTRQTISCGRSRQEYGLPGALTAARRKWPKASK